LAICLLYLTNFFPVHYGVLWSLSVEEQFYAVWPSVVRLLSEKTLFIVCLALIPLCPLLRWFSFAHGNLLGDVHSSTPLIADHFAGGACLAYVLRGGIRRARQGAILARWIVVIGIAILACGYPFGILHRYTSVGAALQTTPFLFIFCGMLLIALLPSVATWMRKRVALQFFGYISYGLYLYHMLFFHLYDWLASKGWLPVVNGRFHILAHFHK
jgi:peptidoglycan/LPS O-acetylase OafA/YrhL